MNPIEWHESGNEPESLALALRAVLSGFGQDRPYDELVAVLGLGAAVVVVENECPARWAAYARDLCLVDAAAGYGVRLRDLHPAAAAARLELSAEFPQHFVDSYVPLMQRALAHGQPLLAWRGWPPPAELDWGVIPPARCRQDACTTNAVEASCLHPAGPEVADLRGYTAGCAGQLVSLVGAAHQVYVVEDYAERLHPVAPAALLEQATAATRRYWDEAVTRPLGIVAGAAACERWIELAATREACPVCGTAWPECHRRGLGALALAQERLARWLLSTVGAADLAPELATRERDWARACDASARELDAAASRLGAASVADDLRLLLTALSAFCRAAQLVP